MKTIKIFMLFITLLSYAACQKCESVDMDICGDPKPNSTYCGWTVASCFAERPGGDVAVVYDSRFNSNAPIGDDWGPTIPTIHPTNWKENQIGQIFGLATDEASNIYLASSDIYFSSTGLPSSNILRPNPSGRVFKCLPPTWTATPLVDLPNTGDPLNGLGNITYDRWNDQLFVTNLEDGKIYKISSGGTILETYDPWAPDPGTMGIVNQDERIWGIGVNQEGSDIKVYFPRITSTSREIYSITLTNGNFPAAGSEVVEIPFLPGTQSIVSDLAFSSNGDELLIAERGNPHRSKVQSYSLSSNVWIFNQQYFVGARAGITSGDGENSAGGVDFAYTELNQNMSEVCDEFFWATGNYMLARNSSLNILYGLEGIAYTGNNSSSAATPIANQDTDLFIDFDGLPGFNTKGHIGDVEVFDCLECVYPCQLNDLVN